MTNENLIKNLCKRANDLWPPDDEFSCTVVSIYCTPSLTQAWFSYWSNDKRDPQRYDIDQMSEGKDLNSALLSLDDFLGIEECKRNAELEKMGEEYLMAHRELIMAGIGFGD